MPLLELKGITKKFIHTVALDHVDFTLEKGEVHALLGENGAGKTTLVNIISGVYQPDEGKIFLEGQQVTFRSPRDAYRKGIVLVPQHPALPESLTVFETLALFLDETPSRALRRWVEDRLRMFNLNLDLDRRISRLTPYEKVKVEIAKALVANAKVYIFDEATSLLGYRDREWLYETVRKLAKEGRGIIYITHRIEEVFNIADRVTVLRKGRKVLTKSIHEVSREELLEAMFGKKLQEQIVRKTSSGKEPILSVAGLTVLDDHGKVAVQEVSLQVRKGEIVTILAAPGSGHRELIEAVVGLRRPVKGQIIVDGVDVTGRDPGYLRKLGVAYIPDDRLGLGVAPGLWVKWNLIMRDLDKFTGKLGMFIRELDKVLKQVLTKVGLDSSILNVPCGELSGGMIQRVIAARELFIRDVKLVVALNPFYGLDYETCNVLRETFLIMRSAGCGVLIATEDVEEAAKLGDRILIMKEGKIVQEVASDKTEVRDLARALAL